MELLVCRPAPAYDRYSVYVGRACAGSARGDWLRTLIAVIVTGAFSLLLYLPFFSNYKALFVGLGLSDMHTEFQPFIIIWGLFLFIGLTYLIGEIQRRTRDRSPARVV